MSRIRWTTLLVALICLPVAVLATGVPLPFVDAPAVGPQPLGVSPGEVELAWLNTTTSWTAWERFVAGVLRTQAAVPGLHVDDRRAYRSQTYEVPELVLSAAGRPGRVRVRWYKLSSEATATGWVQALAARDPAPVGVIGGGSSDRAADLARALSRQDSWHGDRPLLLLTNATANELVDADAPPATSGPPLELLNVYPGRTFRFCFSDRQMAEAALDFVWDQPDLRPQLFAAAAPLAVASGLAAQGWRATERSTPAARRPHVFTLAWLDDPFSRDLNEQFKRVLRNKLRPRAAGPAAPDETPVRFTSREVPFSVGGSARPNAYEDRAAAAVADEFRALPPQRSLVVLPALPTPARRVLRALADAVPDLTHRMVAVNCDGVTVNSVYRDGEFAWPIRDVPVPLVLFTHADPVGWDDPARPGTVPPGAELTPPTSTEDVLHVVNMVRILAEGCFGLRPTDPAAGTPVTHADQLAARLHGRQPAFFDADGNRLGGTGETIVVVRPVLADGPQPDPLARLDVWHRAAAGRWDHVRTLDVDQWRTRAATRPAGPREAAR